MSQEQTTEDAIRVARKLIRQASVLDTPETAGCMAEDNFKVGSANRSSIYQGTLSTSPNEKFSYMFSHILVFTSFMLAEFLNYTINTQPFMDDLFSLDSTCTTNRPRH